jgi:hypothetical protein
MKRSTVLGMALGLIAALALVLVAYAQEQRPPEPTCPEATVTAATWVDEVVTVIHHDAVTHQEWAPPVTHEITVVDQEAWDEWVPPVTHIVHHDAVLGCPTRTFQASHQVCTHSSHGRCDQWITETFGPIVVQYTMGQQHCNRPTGQSLGVPSWAMNEYNQLPQHLDKIVVTPAWDETMVDVPGYFIHHDAVTHQETVVDAEGYWATIVDAEAWDETIITPGYWIDPVCREFVAGCVDPEAVNFNPEAEVDDQSCEYPCALTPLYPMYVLQDFDAPAGYLQGGTCYVISGTFPSVERQAAICTYPFAGGDWTFRADRSPFAGYVSRDCHGNIVYGWSAWDDSWLRIDY